MAERPLSPMRWFYKLPLRLRSLLTRRRVERELSEELRFHFERLIAQNLGDGMSPEEARYAALRELGGLEQIKDECRDVRKVNYAEHFLQDLRYGLRQLRRSPGFTAVAVLSLALGIGANTAIFSLIDALMIKMLPVQRPQQLVLLDWAAKGWPDGIVNSLNGNTSQDSSGRTTSTSFAYPLYEEIGGRNHVFSSVLALAANGSELNVSYKGEPGRAEGDLVTGSFFSALGVEPVVGRAIIADDDRLGASPVAELSYGYWERRFGRDPAVLGQKITVNAVPFTIVGVAPPDFYGVQPGRSVDVWMPIHAQPLVQPSWSLDAADGASSPPPGVLFAARDNWWVLVMGRLKPGISPQQARAELDVILQQSIGPNVKPNTKPEVIPHLEVLPGSKGLDYLRNQFSKPLFVLMTVVGLVLLIACANVANLSLARATSRQKEIAVRLAIGAKRARLIRQLLTESTLLAVLGGALGLALAFWATHILVAFMASGREALSLSVTPNLRVLGFTLAVSLVTGILFGLSPAVRSTRVDLTPALKEGARSLPGRPQRYRGLGLGLGKTLVIAQVGLSLLLLVGAGLFVRTLANLEKVNLGFDERNLLLFGIDPTQDGYRERRLAEFYKDMTRRLQALPGVQSVSLSQHRLIAGGASINMAQILGYVPKSGKKDAGVDTWVNQVGPGFFKTMGIPIVVGRGLNEADSAAAPKVAVANRAFVRKYLGAGNPVGRRLGFGEAGSASQIEIVGVAGDAKYSGVQEDAPPTVYLPYLQEDAKYLGGMNFELRTAGDPMALASATRGVAHAMDPNLALFDVRSQTEQIGKALFQERLFARLTGFFALLAALLGCIGVYGVMAFATNGRTREIGIRMALGASRREILGMVLGETLVLVAIGIAGGTLAALEASRLVATFLFGLKPNDPLTIAGAAVLMISAAALAGYLPARRASKVDPMVALRYE